MPNPYYTDKPKSYRPPRTPLMQLLLKAWRMVQLRRRSAADIPTAPPLGVNLSRRRFVQRSALATLALSTSGLWSSCRKDELDTTRSIAIVGGGMAGLRAANILRKAGFGSTIFEASNRTGGRIYSATNLMGDGLTTELGGEFIDSIHEDMLDLVAEYGLTLLDTQAPSETSLIKDAYFFNGQHYSLSNIIDAFDDIAGAIDNATSNVEYYDNLSISQYLQSIGVSGWLRSLLEVAYTTEYGLEADVQSAVNFLYLISTDTSSGSFDIFGESDERYKVVGGNQQIVDKLAADVSEQIQLGYKLLKISTNADGKYVLAFDKGGGSTTESVAEFVILALPFTMLRDVDLTELNLPAQKTQAINELGYGTNAKLILGFNNRPWRNAGYVGYAFSDNGLQTGWDSSQLQNNNSGTGSYTVFTGGNNGVALADGTPAAQAALYLPLLDQLFAGSAATFNNKAERFHWPTYPFSKGSYPCYLVGQLTAFGETERDSVGKLFFAGDHCSIEYQGYMNGAAETGRMAAEDILSLIN
ncbi:MAG: FAD-dependent oxidoreductase [Chitinophagales bacterium]|nr:FAD-dependent oxidoreductase [Chitinophagales bacterium]